jgi:prevent-host-death family protein
MENMDHIHRVPASDLQARLSELVKRVADNYERIILEQDGRVVALVSIEDLDYLERADRIQDAQDRAELAQEPDDGQTVPFEQVAAELAALDDAAHERH